MIKQIRMNCECGDHVSVHSLNPMFGNPACTKCPCVQFQLAEQPVKKPELTADKLLSLLEEHYYKEHPHISDKVFILIGWVSINCLECNAVIYSTSDPDV